jgi:hypothetical protein
VRDPGTRCQWPKERSRFASRVRRYRSRELGRAEPRESARLARQVRLVRVPRGDRGIREPPRPQERRATVEAIVRRWANLPVNGSGRGSQDPSDSEDEVVRLRALVEHAASLLDDDGCADAALSIRKAAFPHRFRGSIKG